LTKRGPITWLLALLMAAHIVLAAWYSVVVPLWEAPDEPDHYQYAWFLATQRHFPTEMMPLLFPDTDEAHQPPLYYVAGALLIPVLGDAPVLIRQNPYFSWGPGPTKNAWVFHTADEWFPYRDWVLSAHWMRLLSALFGAWLIYLVFRLVQVILPERPWIALGAAALTALRPGMLSSSGTISNDTAVGAFGTLALLLLAQAWRSGVTVRRALAIGGAFGLSLIAKENALALGPVVVLWPTWMTWRATKSPILALRTGALVGGSAAIVGGWWFARNMLLHGAPIQRELSGFEEMPMTALSPLRVVEAAAMYNATFWGSFGWQLLFMPTAWNVPLGVLTLFGLVGGAIAIWRMRGTPRFEAILWLLAALLLTVAITEVRRQLSPQPGRDHARYFLPAIGPLSLLLWLGLVEVSRWLRAPRAPAVLAVGMAGLAIAVPPMVLEPNFPKPEPVRPSLARWRVEQPASAGFGGLVRLGGYDAPRTAAPGGTLNVRLYWEMTGRAPVDYTVFAHLLDPAGERVAQADRPIGSFEYGTSRLLPGEAARTDHTLALPLTLPPGRYALAVGVYPSQGAHDRLQAEGDARGVVANARRITTIDVAGAPPSQPRGVEYGGQLRLTGVQAPTTAKAGTALDLDLDWEALAPVGLDYKVFVHLVDAGRELRGQSDGVLGIAEYSVGRWQVGESIRVRRTVELDKALKPGRYDVLVGLYDPAQPSRRLSIVRSDVEAANDAARVASVEVTAGG
jgi:hypothetical protein